ncbi:hypothetical protein ACFYPN_20650 [Streptomyces sp. NPDC005576]|uniref:hypothetical protein n=1 Tax=Streptomyces sp. NPDC005576 TaxID=3364726 RepID=UPI003695C84F
MRAQDLRAATPGVRVRGSGLTLADVHLAFGAEPTVVRSWFMRGTIHLVPAPPRG